MTENGGYFYSAAPARQGARRDAASALARFSGRIGWRDDELVLDVGCGGGDITNALIMPAVASGVASWLLQVMPVATTAAAVAT